MNYHVYCTTSFKGIVSRDFVGLYNYLFFRLLRFHMKSVIGRATQHFNKGKVLLYTVPKIIWISVLWRCLSQMEQMRQSMSGFYADILFCTVLYCHGWSRCNSQCLVFTLIYCTVLYAICTYTVPKIIWISVLWPCLSRMEQMQQSMSGFYADILYCIICYMYIHCPKNNLNLCFMTVPVMDGADATVNVWFLRVILYCTVFRWFIGYAQCSWKKDKDKRKG